MNTDFVYNQLTDKQTASTKKNPYELFTAAIIFINIYSAKMKSIYYLLMTTEVNCYIKSIIKDKKKEKSYYIKECLPYTNVTIYLYVTQSMI